MSGAEGRVPSENQSLHTLFHQPALGEVVTRVSPNETAFRTLLSTVQANGLITNFHEEGPENNTYFVLGRLTENGDTEIWKYTPDGLILAAGVYRSGDVSSTERSYSVASNELGALQVTKVEDIIHAPDGPVIAARQELGQDRVEFPDRSNIDFAKLNGLATGPDQLQVSDKSNLREILDGLSPEARRLFSVTELPDGRIAIAVPTTYDVPNGLILELHQAVFESGEGTWRVAEEAYAVYGITPQKPDSNPSTKLMYTYGEDNRLMGADVSMDFGSGYRQVHDDRYIPQSIQTQRGPVEVFDIQRKQYFPHDPGNQPSDQLFTFLQYVVLRTSNAGKSSVFGVRVYDEAFAPDGELVPYFVEGDVPFSQKLNPKLPSAVPSNHTLFRTITLLDGTEIRGVLAVLEGDQLMIDQSQTPIFTLVERQQ